MSVGSEVMSIFMLSVMQVLAAASHPPIEQFKFFLTSLLETVRLNIGFCAASSYKTLTLPSATQILMFHSDQVRNGGGISLNFNLFVVIGNQRFH